MCACCCGLLLLRVAMICAGSFFVLFIQLTQVFPFPCMCVLWCSVAAACHNDLLWLLFCFGQYKSQVFLFSCMCVCCGALWLWFATMICFGFLFVLSNLEAFEESC